MEHRYRFLPPNEFVRAAHIFESYGAPVPNPVVSKIAVAEDGAGEIKGMLVMQLVPHEEPLWVAEDARGTVWIPTLIEMVEESARSLGFPGIVTCASDPGVKRFCEANQMDLFADAVYVKRF